MVKHSATQNSHSRENTTSEKTLRLKGVRMRKWGKWVSEVRVPNSQTKIWLGSYTTPQQAARAFDCAQYCLRGPNVNFNFPQCVPQFSRIASSSLSRAEIQAVAANFALQESTQSSDDSSAFSGWECQSALSEQISEDEGAYALMDFLLEDLEGVFKF